jgi:HEAT repeat protein
MIENEDTIPEPRREGLVRASFVDDPASWLAVEAGIVDDDERLRVLALRAGGRHEWLTDDQWITALADVSPVVRREAAGLQARRLCTKTLVAALIIALGDVDPLVVDAAAFALGELHDASSVEALIEVATAHDDARCRECAVASLGFIGDDRARATIIAALNDKPPVRRRAVVALANFDGDDVDAALDAARNDRDWQVRSAVDQFDRGPLGH